MSIMESKSTYTRIMFISSMVIFILLSVLLKHVEAKQYITLGDDEEIIIYNEIPFSLDGVDLDVFHTPFDFRHTESIDMSGHVSGKIHILESAAYATNIPNGVTVGTIKVYYEDGNFDSIHLIMGSNIAEWAYDRPENQCCLAHNKVPPAYSWTEGPDEYSDYPYLGHIFYINIDTQEKPLAYLELSLNASSYFGQPDCPESCDFYHGLETWSGIHVDAITLERLIIKVIQLDTTKDVTIRDNEGNVIGDTVWKATFENGNFIEPPVDQILSIADQKGDGAYFFMDTIIASYPDNTSWEPKVEYEWWVYPQGEDKNESVRSGKGNFNGWSGQVRIDTPQKVGTYEVMFSFDILYDDLGSLIYLEEDQTIQGVKFYVTLKDPKDTGMSKPQENWLAIATDFANAATNEKDVVESITEQIQINPKNWLYSGKENFFRDRWKDILNGTAGDGSCMTFANILTHLSQMLGVEDIHYEEYNAPGRREYITQKGLKLLDGQTGNSFAPPTLCIPSELTLDRWCFRYHAIVKYKNLYYDPMIVGTSSIGFIDKSKDMVWYRPFFSFWINSPHPSSCPPINALKIDFTNTSGDIVQVYDLYEYPIPNGGIYEYHNVAHSKGSSASNVGVGIKSVDASFTENYTILPVDSDEDGKFDKLAFNIDTQIISPDLYSITGSLNFAGTPITYWATHSVQEKTRFIIDNEDGIITAELAFSGEDIFLAGYDGQYTIDIQLTDSDGIIQDQRSITTEHFFHENFRETKGYLEFSSDSGEDIDVNGLFDNLVCIIDLDIIKEGEYTILGVLKSNTTTIGSKSVSLQLNSGSNQTELKFNGKQIYQSKIDGPYQINLILKESTGNQIGYKEAMTNPYTWSQFEPLQVNMPSSLSDFGNDTDGDGFYNYLNIEMSIEGMERADYNIRGWLHDNMGDYITSSHNKVLLNEGSNIVTLAFEGNEIFNHGVNGPYILNHLAIYDETGNFIIDTPIDYHTTSSYQFSYFGIPCEGDFDNNQKVDHSDLEVFYKAFGITNCGEDCRGDFDNDIDVDGSDLATFAEHFGRTDCSPPE